MTNKSAKFIIYMINELSNVYSCPTSKIYHILDKVKCIDNYLVPFYDVLHTMGVEALVDDITEYICKRSSFELVKHQTSDKEFTQQIYREHLEEDIIFQISKTHKVDLENAMRIYYNSKLAEQVYNNEKSIRHLNYIDLTKTMEQK